MPRPARRRRKPEASAAMAALSPRQRVRLAEALSRDARRVMEAGLKHLGLSAREREECWRRGYGRP